MTTHTSAALRAPKDNNVHFRLPPEDVTAAKRRAHLEFLSLTDVVKAAVKAYGAGLASVSFPAPAVPDE
jgi:predicted DNA binding CopG/RHH family protein